jgi:hypothetical protein
VEWQTLAARKYARLLFEGRGVAYFLLQGLWQPGLAAAHEAFTRERTKCGMLLRARLLLPRKFVDFRNSQEFHGHRCVTNTHAGIFIDPCARYTQLIVIPKLLQT